MESSQKYLFIGAGVAFVALGVGGYLLFASDPFSKLDIAEDEGGPTASWTVKSGSRGSTFSVVWQNLPGDTSNLQIYKAKDGTEEWALWASVPVSNGSEASGTVEMATGKKLTTKDKFLVKAISQESSTILWTSPSSTPAVDVSSPPPVVPTSTPSVIPTSTPPVVPTSTPPVTPTSTPPVTPTSTPTSTPPVTPTSTPPEDPPPSPPPPLPPPAPTIPSFQVSNSIEWIEITWQHLPTSTTFLVFSRADNPGGPWEDFFSQSDPETGGPYTVKVVIDTPNTPFYYELTVYDNGTLIDTYGPVYLSALQP